MIVEILILSAFPLMGVYNLFVNETTECVHIGNLQF